MNKEKVKTVFLVLLVCLSVFLTWSIWTYSPNITPFDQSEFIQDEVTVNDQEETKNIIKPHQMMLHVGDMHYGSYKDKEIDAILKEMTSWSFSEYRNISDRIDSGDFQSFLYQDGFFELLFPDDIPLKTYGQVINFENLDELGDDLDFNRILISTKETESQELKVRFVQTKDKKIHEFTIRNDDFGEYMEFAALFEKEQPEYEIANMTANKHFYLPVNETEVNSYKYYPDLLDIQKFRETLFEDPSTVKKETVADGEEYTDGTSKMKVTSDTMTLRYIDPPKNKGTQNVNRPTTDMILDSSIEYVNEHSGWDDNYRFVNVADNNSKTIVKFRLFAHGLPVFNGSGMSEIVQEWEYAELTRYSRPIFTLDISLNADISPVKLYGAEEIISIFEEMNGFDPDALEAVTIGYDLYRDQEDTRLVELEPAWFYKYNGEWSILTSVGKTGGMMNGLE